jgi:phosphatidylethanolamine/phosphatidyl-N-methylethanolamine N-methyltransferase
MTHVMKSGLTNAGVADVELDDSDLQTGQSTGTESSTTVSNPWMFFRRWLANPLQMGSIIPSSPTLCRNVVRQIRRAPGEYVVELGAGTGVVSRAMLNAGIPPENIYVVEIVPTMAEHLRRVLPGVNVISGDALELPELLPAHVRGNIGTVICGIPLVLLPIPLQRRFIDVMEAVAPGRGFLHFSYCVTSPLPYQKHQLSAKRESWTPKNFPPASVWRYTPQR